MMDYSNLSTTRDRFIKMYIEIYEVKEGKLKRMPMVRKRPIRRLVYSGQGYYPLRNVTWRGWSERTPTRISLVYPKMLDLSRNFCDCVFSLEAMMLDNNYHRYLFKAGNYIHQMSYPVFDDPSEEFLTREFNRISLIRW